jgi:hypothetical protein
VEGKGYNKRTTFHLPQVQWKGTGSGVLVSYLVHLLLLYVIFLSNGKKALTNADQKKHVYHSPKFVKAAKRRNLSFNPKFWYPLATHQYVAQNL